MGKYYYYYHCTSQCGTRFKAGDANEAFSLQLRRLSPCKAIVDMYIDSFFEEYNNRTKSEQKERKELLAEIDALNNRLREALIQKIDGKLDDDHYQSLKRFTNEKFTAELPMKNCTSN